MTLVPLGPVLRLFLLNTIVTSPTCSKAVFLENTQKVLERFDEIDSQKRQVIRELSVLA